MRTRGDVTTGVNRPVFDHVQQLASMGIEGDAAMQRSFFGSQPFSEQLLGHVAEQSAANRALELELQKRNTAPWQVDTALRGIGLAGLFLS
jgi:hypothetical protein